MKPLVLIPGIQGRWEWMQPAIDELAKEWRVIPCSLPGEPGTPVAANGNFESFVDYVDSVLDAASIERAVICGVSFGGLVALRYAARRPGRTEALILVSTPGPHWKPKAHLVRYMNWPTLSSPLFFAGAFGRFWPELRVTYPDAAQRIRFCAAAMTRVLAAPAIPSRMSHRAQMAARESFAGDCACVKAPTLVITGERDLDRVVKYDETMDYVSLIEGAQPHLLEHTGHLGIISAPDRFAAIVSQFGRTL
jgi:pimeloyl-ACP methyl ester carboxylesterase